MRKILLVILTVLTYLNTTAQIPAKKYPSLLWEITGNGMSKPSYLFGTMHVSNKMVFNLPDSFYYCIKRANVVALENNPEYWQSEMSKYDFGELGQMSGLGGMLGTGTYGNSYLSISDFQLQPFVKKLQWALSSNPSILNSLLYRSYGSTSNDFEEDTYLDMYIYQIGKKLKKSTTGVEEYKKSMEMAIEATMDMYLDKNKKSRSYNSDEEFAYTKLNEAYRTGNLDWLDTINKVNSRSDAFDEKFIYLRNDIQAHSIDSIIKSGTSLFVGVGAAHLPGQRGVIEVLRNKGYKLRPIKWGQRSSEEKVRIDKIRIPLTFSKQTSEDGFYSVSVPGKLYPSDNPYLVALYNQAQYADMGNGSYYVVTRVQTNAALAGFSEKEVAYKLDSILYENIPGKIISKTNITNNGYQGIEVLNKTRRGDMQRYRVFITPFEVIFFKMSGTGDYITLGTEANTFFSSIYLKPMDNATWKKFTPSFGSFSVDMPGTPTTSISSDIAMFEAVDKVNNVQYGILRKDVHNYDFAEEDTFDLSLLDASFGSSDFVEKSISKQNNVVNGYPILDVKYRDKTGGYYQCRYLIQGPHYYALIAHYKNAEANTSKFFNSFRPSPIFYGSSELYSDSSLSYSVNTPYVKKDKKEKVDLVNNMRKLYDQYRLREEDSEADTSSNGLEIWEGKTMQKDIRNDTTGENIQIYYSKPARYYDDSDSTNFKRLLYGDKNEGDTTWIVRSKTTEINPNGVSTRYTVYSDTNSSRVIRTKVFYRNGVFHTLASEGDTLTQPSAFVRSYFETFKPINSLDNGFSPFEKKSKLFFKDYFSNDTTVSKRAARFIQTIYLDSSNLPDIEKAINALGWKNKRYMDKKTAWLQKLGEISNIKATEYLKQAYVSASDTTELQTAILKALLGQQTQTSFNVFKDIVTNDAPVLDITTYSRRSTSNNEYDLGMRSKHGNYLYSNSPDIFYGLYDSLKLTKTIFPELLPLVNLDDYKWKVMALTSILLDSNLITGNDYKIYFQKFYLEAKQEMKKQSALERKNSIEAATKEDYSEESVDTDADRGNDDLQVYAKLLLPFYDSNENVKNLFGQLLNSNDKSLKYEIYSLLLKSKKMVSDTFANYFASNDDYRYDFYNDLNKLKMLDKFPAKYNNHIDLAKSELLQQGGSYSKPDSIVYIGQLPTKFKGQKGKVYFFKYKLKKDDFAWKIALAGMTPEDEKAYFFPVIDRQGKILDTTPQYDYSLTDFSNTTLKEETPLQEQLEKALNRRLVEKRKSGKIFYQSEQGKSYSDVVD